MKTKLTEEIAEEKKTVNVNFCSNYAKKKNRDFIYKPQQK